MKLRMGELTGGEARAVLARRPVILLPLGSHESQGPHAPMGDYLSAERMAEHIAERAGALGTETLVAPVLPFGGADFFGAFPGGIALSQDTLRAVLGDMLGCLLRHDLTRLVIINGHGGNTQAIRDVTQAIYLDRRVLIPSFYLWRIAYGLLPPIVGEQLKTLAGHGADPLTSVAMHLFPALMRPDLVPQPRARCAVLGMPVTGFGTARFEEAEIDLPVELDEIAPDGVVPGLDPSLCSAATGAAVVARLTELGARFVRHYGEQTA